MRHSLALECERLLLPVWLAAYLTEYFVNVNIGCVQLKCEHVKCNHKKTIKYYVFDINSGFVFIIRIIYVHIKTDIKLKNHRILILR